VYFTSVLAGNEKRAAGGRQPMFRLAGWESDAGYVAAFAHGDDAFPTRGARVDLASYTFLPDGEVSRSAPAH